MELIRKSDAMHAVLHNEGQAAVAAIEAIKPDDVAPVVHSYWKDSDMIPGMKTCANCGVQRNPKFKIGFGYWLYCPNCGAIMDGERKDNDTELKGETK